MKIKLFLTLLISVSAFADCSAERIGHKPGFALGFGGGYYVYDIYGYLSLYDRGTAYMLTGDYSLNRKWSIGLQLMQAFSEDQVLEYNVKLRHSDMGISVGRAFFRNGNLKVFGGIGISQQQNAYAVLLSGSGCFYNGPDYYVPMVYSQHNFSLPIRAELRLLKYNKLSLNFTAGAQSSFHKSYYNTIYLSIFHSFYLMPALKINL